jgi:hypothetical protein
MAKLLCKVHWNATNHKVETTYQVLEVEPNDTIQLTTNDSKPIIIQTKSAQIVNRLQLQKAQGANENDLYQVPHIAPHLTPPDDGGTPLDCGTLDNQGNFVPWGPGIPLKG